MFVTDANPLQINILIAGVTYAACSPTSNSLHQWRCVLFTYLACKPGQLNTVGKIQCKLRDICTQQLLLGSPCLPLIIPISLTSTSTSHKLSDELTSRTNMVTNLPFISGAQGTILAAPRWKTYDSPPQVGFPIPPLTFVKPTLIDSSVTFR